MEENNSCAATAARLRQAINALSTTCPALRLESVIVFLSVCENEGLSIKDLVFACGLGESMVSRTVDALTQPDQGALLETVRHPTDGRRRLVYLTEAGQAVLTKLQTIIDNTPETA